MRLAIPYVRLCHETAEDARAGERGIEEVESVAPLSNGGIVLVAVIPLRVDDAWVITHVLSNSKMSVTFVPKYAGCNGLVGGNTGRHRTLVHRLHQRLGVFPERFASEVGFDLVDLILLDLPPW